jgi:hypothetical protein
MSPQHDSQHELASSSLAVPQIKSKTFDRKRLIPSVYIGKWCIRSHFPDEKGGLRPTRVKTLRIKQSKQSNQWQTLRR